MRLLPQPPEDATPREARLLEVGLVASTVGFGGAVAGLLGQSTPALLAGLCVWLAGWVAIGYATIRAVHRRERRARDEVERRHAELHARHEARLAELAELRRRAGLPPREEDR